MSGFDDDLIACAELVEKGDPDRFRAVMAAPVAARPLLFALYAFNIELARAPWASAESMIAEMRVQWWRDVGAELAQGGTVRRHYVATPLSRLLRPDLAGVIDAMCEARRWDIYREPFEDEAALETYLDATAGSLMWMAAASLSDADEAVVRDVGFASGLASYFGAIPGLEAQKRVPLPDGRPEAVSALARKGLERLNSARAKRSKVSRAAAPALLPAWQAETILRQAAQTPHRVADGTLDAGGLRSRLGLMWQAASGRW